MGYHCRLRQSTFAEATVDEESKKAKVNFNESPPGRGKGWVKNKLKGEVRVKNKETGLYKTRLGSSYLTLVISVSLVLFLLGVLGLILINARELSDYFRESLSFSVMLDDEAKEADIRMLQKDLDAKLYVKSTKYVSKDEAAAKMKVD
ncbi:MAG: hypothetical protein IMZ52_03930, partial [Actinobacteria bacterium]|nr:hypothetical protein [Actinomycetota bacterium]